MAAIIEVKYFNSFLLRKAMPSSNKPTWNGSTGIPVAIGGFQRDTSEGVGSWVVEEARIRGGYNNTNVDYGVKAYLVEDEPNAVSRGNSFTDKDRNAILRLSMDGLTEISTYGMYDYFRDEFARIDTLTTEGNIVGGWDIYNKQYVLSTQAASGNISNGFNTLTFDENVKGWTSFFSYKPDQVISLRSDFYSLNSGKLYKHNSNDVARGNFYGETNNTSIQFVFNPRVSLSKVFKTVNYEGSNGWQVTNFSSDQTGSNLLNGNWSSSFDTANVTNKPTVYSYDEGVYTENGVKYRVGFNRKENKYCANLVNNTTANQEEVLFGNSVTGIKGYFSVVTVSTDATTDPGGLKELFAVSSDYSESSY